MTHNSDGPGADQLQLAAQLVHMTHSGALIQAACLAAELNIADLLADGPKRADALAQATQSHPPSLWRLMRALVSLGLCTESDGAFALTPMGELLRSGSPNSLRAWMLWYGGFVWPVWAHLRHSIKSGESARGLATGVHGFSSFSGNLAAAALFNGAMDELARLILREVIRVYDFSAARCIVDVGGGQGA
ncbi:MAG TPA: methyltransferase, partial [Xanthobacteraceae bacterium]|nr:methyltransferase [Xanthobacteraceae bacterium]